MFGKIFKSKVISNVATLDLRPYAIGDSFGSIRKIENVATLIVPKDMDEKTAAAFAKISIKNVASTVALDNDAQLHQINGSNIIDMINDPGLHIISGIGIIKDVAPDKDIRLMTNGIAVFNSACKDRLNLLACNGISHFADLSGDVKLFSNKTSIDAKSLEYIKENAVFVAGNKIIIEEDVTSDMLAKKNIQLVAGNKVVCGDDAMAYVRTNASVGNKVQSLKEYNNLSEKDKDIK